VDSGIAVEVLLVGTFGRGVGVCILPLIAAAKSRSSFVAVLLWFWSFANVISLRLRYWRTRNAG
jgi:hypothetical protein